MLLDIIIFLPADILLVSFVYNLSKEGPIELQFEIRKMRRKNIVDVQFIRPPKLATLFFNSRIIGGAFCVIKLLRWPPHKKMRVCNY